MKTIQARTGRLIDRALDCYVIENDQLLQVSNYNIILYDLNLEVIRGMFVDDTHPGIWMNICCRPDHSFAETGYFIMSNAV